MSTSFQSKMPSASSLFTAYASLLALAILLRSIFNELIPKPVRAYFLNLCHRLFKPRSNKLTLVIEKPNSNCISSNEVYDAAELYLSTKITTPSTDRLKISKYPKDKTLTICFENGEIIDDSFEGVILQWRFLSVESSKRRNSNDDDDSSSTSTKEVKYFELTLDKEHKEYIINNYIPYILSKSDMIQAENKTLKLCTLVTTPNYRGSVYWDTTNLEHPSTFDTLAMIPEAKSAIKADLDRFVRRREFYKRVGRAWKRGYLLYGPPGTGKSSLVAAMANYLRFDVYDLQLGNSITDADLRRLLLATANRSILVIEDIDCTIDIKNRTDNKDGSNDNNRQNHQNPPQKLTLSGLLNFIDGLWSSCGDERIIIFTTNHKEKLDPALLRPGRMDMHIHMSYLTVQGFRLLISNYLEIDEEHQLFSEIERLIETINVSPAQVAEELMRSEDVDEALEGVAKLLVEMEKLKNCQEVCKKDEVENGHAGNFEGENGDFEGENEEI